MGVVLLAEDLELKRSVVVKLTRGVAQEELRDRAIREGRLLAEIRHPHVVEVYDAGEGDLGPYLVMEYLDGAPLSQGVPDPLVAMEPLIGALESVHSAGLVHRDLKPDNVFRCHDGRVVLVDFGLALGPGQTRLTGTGLVVGTLPFMAPETLRGEPYTPASDWYGWGATLYTMLAGRPPRATEALFAYARGEEAPPLDLASISAPKARELLAEALELDPKTRAGPSRLREIYSGVVGPSGATTQAQEVLTSTGLGEHPEPSRGALGRRGWVLGVVAVGLVVGLGWPASRAVPSSPSGNSSVVPSPAPDPTAHVLRRGELDQALLAFDRAWLYPRDSADPHSERPGPRELEQVGDVASTGALREPWQRLIRASFRWLESLPEEARQGRDFESEELLWRQLVPRTRWQGTVRSRLMDLVSIAPAAQGWAAMMNADRSRYLGEADWDRAAMGRELEELVGDTAMCLVEFDRPGLRSSPLWARLNLHVAWRGGALEAAADLCPEGWPEALLEAYGRALSEKRGNPSAWWHDQNLLMKEFPDPRRPTARARLSVIRLSRERVDPAPNTDERDYRLLCLAREAIRVARCEGESREARQLAEEAFEEFRAGWSGREERGRRFAADLIGASQDRRCSDSPWARSLTERIRGWEAEARGDAGPGRSP